jgi:hypothetical protein
MVLPKGLLSECRLAAGGLGQDCPLVFLELLWRLESGQAIVGAPMADDQRVNGSRVLTRPRGGGKTTEAVHWLAAGHPIGDHPKWSRVLAVPTQGHYDHIRRQWAHALMGSHIDLDRVLVTMDEAQRLLRGASQAVQVGCEDVDIVIAQALGFNPDVVTMTGLTVPHLPGRDAPSGPLKFLV